MEGSNYGWLEHKMNELYNLPCVKSGQLLKWESLCSFCGRTFVVVEEIFTSVACDFGDMWAYNVCCLLCFLHYDS